MQLSTNTTHASPRLIPAGHPESAGLALRHSLADQRRGDMAFDYFEVDWDAVVVPEETRESFALALGLWVTAGMGHRIWRRPDFDYRSLFADRYSEVFHFFNSPEITSPIEHRMIGLLAWLDGEAFGFPQKDNGWIEGEMQLDPDDWRIFVSPQHRIGSWRVDFLIAAHYRGSWSRIVVECDGHDFHEKTKEQAARDKSRDRDLVVAGCKVLRFTGSEIFRNPTGCYVQLQEVLYASISELTARG